jgi:hypothetical protein
LFTAFPLHLAQRHTHGRDAHTAGIYGADDRVTEHVVTVRFEQRVKLLDASTR